ncbi:UPF0434 protein Mmar10_2939-like [Glandiceps talaboti]
MAAIILRKSMPSLVNRFSQHQRFVVRSFHMDCVVMTAKNDFDEKLLDILVCPLSKKPLRYDKEKNELVNDTMGVAYPILPNGVPNLIPQDARMFKNETNSKQTNTKTEE